jgi:acetyl esterase/lipase
LTGSEDKADHSGLAINLVTRLGFAVAVPNYVLSPQEPAELPIVRHPRHAEDILAFLKFVTEHWNGLPDYGAVFDPTVLYLLGHSCSAHMLSSIILDSSAHTPSLTPSPTIQRAVRTMILSEGIYDLDLLIASFPTYKEWFIQNAFGNEDSYAETSVAKLALRESRPRWLILHSKGDTLVDEIQSQAMYDHLIELYGQDAPHHVQKDFDSLTEEHNDILKTKTYVHLVSQFIKQK